MSRHFKTTEIQTFSGKAFDYANPNEHRMTINDITNSLAKVCRYGGHSKYHFSVAAHSYLVGRMMEIAGEDEEACFYGYVHDFPESVYCDLPRPMKNSLGNAGLLTEYKKMEKIFMERFYDNLNIRYPLEETIKTVEKYDILALEYEMANVLSSSDYTHEFLNIKDKDISYMNSVLTREGNAGRFFKDTKFLDNGSRYKMLFEFEEVFSHNEGDFAYGQHKSWANELKNRICNYI